MDQKYFGFLQHYYRAEVYRETSWRNRLDITTNWTIVATAAMLSYVFSNRETTHTIIVINFLLVWFFLYIESRRFRYYTLFKSRTRIFEQKVLGRLLSEGVIPDHTEWGKTLKASLDKPRVAMSRLESVAWRIRRNYIFVFPLLFIAWLAKVSMSPVKALTLDQIFVNARMWAIPGEVVFYGFLFSILSSVAIAFYIPHKSLVDDLP